MPLGNCFQWNLSTKVQMLIRIINLQNYPTKYTSTELSIEEFSFCVPNPNSCKTREDLNGRKNCEISLSLISLMFSSMDLTLFQLVSINNKSTQTHQHIVSFPPWFKRYYILYCNSFFILSLTSASHISQCNYLSYFQQIS